MRVLRIIQLRAPRVTRSSTHEKIEQNQFTAFCFFNLCTTNIKFIFVFKFAKPTFYASSLNIKIRHKVVTFPSQCQVC